MSGLNELLSKLDRVRKTGAHSWRACCPGHSGKNPTALAITETQDGMVLLRCHVGCSADQIVSAVGMSLSDLFPEVDGHARKPERLPFNPKDLLAACASESLLVYLCAKDVASGKVLTNHELKRLLEAASRIRNAAGVANAI